MLLQKMQAEENSKLRNLVNRAIDASFGVIYPPTCPGCDDPIPSSRIPLPICPECGPKLNEISLPYCNTCGQPFDGNLSHSGDFQCSNCKERKLGFDFAIAGYKAEGLARDLMHQFKYEKNIHLVKLLGRLMEPALKDSRIQNQEWILVPVPLHLRRFLHRGFNQAFELCRILRERNPQQFTINKSILRRRRHTKRQAGLDREERLSNLKGAFAIQRFFLNRDDWKGKRILLVDDVLTTGATASECAQVLKNELELAEIGVLTVLRG